MTHDTLLISIGIRLSRKPAITLIMLVIRLVQYFLQTISNYGPVGRKFKISMMLRQAFLCSFFLTLCASSAHAQNYEQIAGSGFDEGGWVGFALYEKSTGLFDHCSAMTYFDNGEVMQFLVGGRGKFAVVLPIVAPKGITEIRLFVDDLPPLITTGHVDEFNKIFVPLNHVSNSLEVFKGGWFFTYEVNGSRFTYKLRGTRLGIEAAESCAESYYLYLAPKNQEPTQQDKKSQPEAEFLGKTGTGFYVSSFGHILTNNHVISGCRSIQVDSLDAVVVATSETFDLAVLQVFGASDFHVAEFSDETAGLNSDIVIAGYPYSDILNGLNITRGTVSSAGGLRGDSTMFQISAPIQPGNSGGPVVTLDGRVVGVVVAKLNPVIDGDIPQNVNFAVRGELAKKFLFENKIDPVIGRRGQVVQNEDLAEVLDETTVFVQCE